MKRLWIALAVAFAVVAGSTVAPVVAPVALAANALPTNPLGLAYSSTTGVSSYGRSTGMVVTGPCNRYAPEFAAARANGAEILTYLNFVERPDTSACALSDAFFGGPPGSTPLWPYPTPGRRVNWPGTHLLDIRTGEAWADHAVAYIENLMREDRVDGVFLDVVGIRLWSSLAAWESWPQGEKDAWAAGNVDFVRRLDASRRAINPRFIIVNNNKWDTGGGVCPDEPCPGEQHVDGISLELHDPAGPYHQRVAGKPYSNLGHRRVIAIARTTAEARQWATVQGVTHVSDQTNYSSPTPPPIGFTRLTDRPKSFGRTTVATNLSILGANQKRGSKFALPDGATLLGFSAYLDGLGAASGSQTARMVLYNDNNGVPHGRVAQSNTITISAGTSASWVNFTAPATALDPGQYWIVIHTGDTDNVIRKSAFGPANWYSNLDNFADGSNNPFGAGTTGTTTLSATVSYTVGY
jgi:hypothetical protein